MSKFTGHEPCPNCKSKDNLARYDDGHAYCFGCGYVEVKKPKLPDEIKEVINPPAFGGDSQDQKLIQVETKVTSLSQFPLNSTPELPPNIFKFLTSYGITWSQMRAYDVHWNDKLS